MRYEYPCFLTVDANTRAEADAAAREIVDEFSASGEFSFSLDDGEPTVVDDD